MSKPRVSDEIWDGWLKAAEAEEEKCARLNQEFPGLTHPNRPSIDLIFILELRDARRDLAASEAGIRAIGSAMGSDRLTAIEIERLIREGNAKATQMYTDLAETRDKLAASEQRCRELEGDAKRYRYIRTEAMIVRYGRSKADTWKISWPLIAAPIQYAYATYRERFDAAIDTAIAAQRQKEGE